MVCCWRKDQANLFNGELKMSAKWKTMGCYTLKDPKLDQTVLEWFSEQRNQGEFFRSELPLSRTLEFNGSKPIQWSPVLPRRGTTLQWPLMAENYHLQWASKCMHSTRPCCSIHCLCISSTRRAGWMGKVNYCRVCFFISKFVMLIPLIFRIVNVFLTWVFCYWFQV